MASRAAGARAAAPRALLTEQVAEELATLVELDVRREVGEGRVLASQEPGSVLPLVLSHVLIAALGGGRSAALDYVRSCAGPSGDVKQFERCLRDALVPGKSIKVHRKLLDKVRSTLKSAARQASAASLAAALRERVCEMDRATAQLEAGTGERLSCEDAEALAHALEGLARRLRLLGGGGGGGSPASGDGTEPGSPSSGGSRGGSSGWGSFEPHGYGGPGPYGGGGSGGSGGGLDEDGPFDGDFDMDFARLQARQLAFDEEQEQEQARRAASPRARQAPAAPERVHVAAAGAGAGAGAGAAPAVAAAAPPPLPPRKAKAKALTPILAASAAATAPRTPPSPAAIAAGAAAELEPDSDDDDDEADAQTDLDDGDQDAEEAGGSSTDASHASHHAGSAEGEPGSPDGSSVDGAGNADVDSLATSLSSAKLESTSKFAAAAAASSPRAGAFSGVSPSAHAPAPRLAAVKKRWSVKGLLSGGGASGTAH